LCVGFLPPHACQTSDMSRRIFASHIDSWGS
jgi:hypothetical protein